MNLKVKLSVFRLVLPILFATQLFADQSTLYSENVFQNRHKNVVHFAKFHFERNLSFLPNNLAPYIELSLNQDWRSQTRDIYNDNQLSTGVGLRYFPYPSVSVFTEMRYVQKTNVDWRHKNWDVRAGIYGYEQYSMDFISKSMFFEGYVESIYTHRLEKNLLSMLQGKLFYRFELTKDLFFDPYLQNKYSVGIRNHDYNNFIEGHMGTRIIKKFDQIRFDFMVQRVFGSSWVSSQNPTYSDWQALLVVSAWM